MENLNFDIDGKDELRSKWRFTKYYTGREKTPEEKSRHLRMEFDDEKECKNRPTDMPSISGYVAEWTRNHVGFDFKFREHQFEYIVQVLYNILNDGVKINCIEAPTGSGKSWIAFIVSGVAWEYYRKSSYILVSDLGLMEQYMNDVSKYKFNVIGKMKGLANYNCSENGMIFPNGECKIHKVPYSVLMNPKLAQEKGFYCTEECPCILDRKKAISSPITIMTYILYLCHMNDVRPIYLENGEMPPFDKRDIVICDEVHKMPDIVQNWCSPEFSEDSDMNNFQIIIDYCLSEGLLNSNERDYCTVPFLIDSQHGIVKNIDNKEVAFDFYKSYLVPETALYNKIDKIVEIFKTKEQNGVKLTKEEKQVQYVCSWLETRHTRLATYPKIIEKIGYDNMVVNSAYDWKTKTYDEKKFKINCVYEEWLVNEFFNNVSNFELMMSATIGDYNLFKKEIGVELLGDALVQFKSFRFLRIPSTFDFSKSPIYFAPNYKMTYAEKEKNTPMVIKIIEKILDTHKNQRGIIHTGSYDFSNRLFKGIGRKYQNRLLCYSNAKEKDAYLDEYLFYKDKVLVGPTLVEGINLPDDDCRFMIVMKIPYPNLGDQLVSAKKDAIYNWYVGTTLNSVIQSFGRGIRHKEDWCDTYVVDGCFQNILNQKSDVIPKEILDRIQTISL